MTDTQERAKYVVFKANIMDDDGVKRRDGDVVELTQKTAKRYNKLGFLRPFMEEEDTENSDDADDTVGNEAPKLARSRRAAAESNAT